MKLYKMLWYITIILCSLLFISSCTFRYSALPKLNIAGPKISESKIKISDYHIVDKAAKGKDTFIIVIFIPILKNNQDNYEGMISNAIEKLCLRRKFKFMTNVKIYTSGFYIPYVYGEVDFIIEGEGWAEKESSLLYHFDLWEEYNYLCLMNGEMK